jgi:parallel beta-helix repeat protein
LFQITATTPKNGAVELAWAALSAATQYGISHSRTSGVFTDNGNQNATSPSTVTGLNNGFNYHFMVKATTASGTQNAASSTAAMPMYKPTLTYNCLRNFYIATTGSDSNSGTSPSQAYKTINAATTRNDLLPGDCLNVQPGNYTEAVVMDKGGTNASPNGYVVLRSSTPQAAKLLPPVSGTDPTVGMRASYIILDGFDVKGGIGSGIDACIFTGKHHMGVLNNVVHDSGGSGISMCWGDYFHVEGNVTYNNANTSTYQGSGISIYEAQKFDDAAGFHITVRNNIAYNNRITFNCASKGLGAKCHTDGNGIIIDDFQNSQAAGNGINYSRATLVENNLVFNNGGAGILVFLSDNVTVRNNTAYFNSTDLDNNATWRAEMTNSFSANNKWIHNIAVANPSISNLNYAYQNVSVSPYLNPGVVWQNNIGYANGTNNIARVDTAGTFTVTAANPLFVAASIDPLVADFRLQAGSPARSAGTSIASPTPDNLNGVARSTTTPDLGAY